MIYTVEEAAEKLGIAPVTARYRARVNKIGRKLGRDWAFTDGDLAALAECPSAGRPVGGSKAAAEEAARSSDPDVDPSSVEPVVANGQIET